jgi:hypothetical protein
VSIRIDINPETARTLKKLTIESQDNINIINSIIALQPTQTYSTFSPSGTAPIGSIWFKDTGLLATREIHMYSGSAWVQFK